MKTWSVEGSDYVQESEDLYFFSGSFWDLHFLLDKLADSGWGLRAHLVIEDWVELISERHFSPAFL